MITCCKWTQSATCNNQQLDNIVVHMYVGVEEKDKKKTRTFKQLKTMKNRVV